MAKILIVGCGSIGRELGNVLTLAGHEVIGLKRKPPSSNTDKFSYFCGDITLSQSLSSLPTDFEIIYFIVSPDRRNDDSYHNIYDTGLNNLIDHLSKGNSLASWIFVSSTSVYGQSQGEWVDELAPALGSSNNSLQILAAEQKLNTLNPDNVIVRFSGIYGPGREYLINRAKQHPDIQQSPHYFTNRIHQRDCVGILAFLLEQRLFGVSLESCYLASDNNPAPLWEVISWLAEQMNYPPPRIKAQTGDIDMNKRCNNSRLKNLGYNFYYPDYQCGYIEMIASITS